MKAYLKMTQAGLRSFLRDKTGLFWSMFFPIFFIMLFGSIFDKSDKGEGIKFKIGMVVEDESGAAKQIAEGLRKVPVFTITDGTLDEEKKALQKGDIRTIIVIPKGLGETLLAGDTADIKLLTDPNANPSQIQTTQMVAGIAQQVIGEIDQGISHRKKMIQAKQETIESGADATKKPRTIDLLIPGILAMTITQLGLFSAIPIINMREKGIMKRLRATPLTRTALVGAHITQRLVIGVVQTFIIVLLGVVMFHFRVVGSWLALLGIVMLGVLAFVCIGAIISSIAKTQESGTSLVQLINLPMMFLSGIFFPVDILPSFLAPFVKALPTTYLADGLRSIMLATPAQHPMTMNLGVLAAWLVGGLLLAARMFRWE